MPPLSPHLLHQQHLGHQQQQPAQQGCCHLWGQDPQQQQAPQACTHRAGEGPSQALQAMPVMQQLVVAHTQQYAVRGPQTQQMQAPGFCPALSQGLACTMQPWAGSTAAGAPADMPAAGS
jgi:hypothetical protein